MVAAFVYQLDRRPFGPVNPSLAPILESNDDRIKIDSLLSEEIFVAVRSLLIGAACDDTRLFQLFHPNAEKMGRYARKCLKMLESLPAHK